MTERTTPDLDLGQIARSGQCFRMNETGKGRYALVAFGRRIELEQQGETVRFGCGEDELQRIWRPYFDLDADYGAFKRAVPPQDEYLRAAVRAGGGIRILRQELFETIVCFIISQQNNIARIKKCVEDLCSLFGETCYTENGTAFHAFPAAERLAALTADELAPVRLGYRAGYVAAAARQIASGEVDLDAVRRMDHENARAALLRLTGVGVKVAECVCLFALHHIDAFPVDTHIRRMLDTHYPDGFPMDRYKGFAGVMQQYGFYYERGG